MAFSVGLGLFEELQVEVWNMLYGSQMVRRSQDIFCGEYVVGRLLLSTDLPLQ